ncbi:MAG: glutamate--tRNA ligase [Bacteroidetes bacterium]|nr:glutamate--tRNA ligase [Bacteroidota bacterium]
MSTERPVRVRFAPSPTGPLHIGGVRTALYNYLLARKHGGTMILRIEDTDQNRFVPGAEQYIMESLKWVGIEIDEGIEQGGPHAPYRQSERKPMYAQYAYDMIEKGFAYYAFDTEEDIEQMRKRLEASKMQPAYDSVSRMSMKNSITLPADEVKMRLDRGDNYVIRIKLPRKEEVRFHDVIRGWVVVNTSTMDDKVLLKGDGMPTYHLANVVDDYLMGISHVIRGEEWLPSAPLHVMLYRYLGWEDVMPEFAHLPLLLKPEGNGKLSKRDGDRLGFPVFPLQWTDPKTNEVSSGYKESGYYPEAVTNMLALLGWHPSGNQEMFSMEELIQEFSLERVSKSGAKFDLQKALWFNQQYLQQKPLSEQYEILKPMIEAIGYDTCQEYVEQVVVLMREKVQFVKDVVEEGYYFFEAPKQYDEEVVRKKWKAETNAHILGLAQAFEGLAADANAEAYENAFKSYCETAGIKTGEVLQPLRVAVSGAPMGPPIWEMIALIGRDYVLPRLREAAANIQPVVA